MLGLESKLHLTFIPEYQDIFMLDIYTKETRVRFFLKKLGYAALPQALSPLWLHPDDFLDKGEFEIFHDFYNVGINGSNSMICDRRTDYYGNEPTWHHDPFNFFKDWLEIIQVFTV